MEQAERIRAIDTPVERDRPPRGNQRAAARRKTLWDQSLYAIGSVLFCTAIAYLVWEIAVLAQWLPQIVLPTPLQVAQAFGTELQSGDLLSNLGVTLQEALTGFLLAAVVAGIVGYAIARIRFLELLVAPFIAASQGVPAVAVAPIVILMLGTGLWPKAVICAAVVIFPLLVSTVTALRGIAPEYRDVARVFGASPWQMLRYVELPLAAPVLLAGFKLGLTLSITGAVVAEFVASDAGLGFMVNTAINSFEVSTRYVALITLALLSAVLYGAATLAERILQQWLEE